MHYSEIYILSDTVKADDWQMLGDAISQYGGSLARYKVIVKIADNTVKFFVESAQELSGLSNSVTGMVLRPVGAETAKLPQHHGKQRFVQFVTGGNLLDLKEKYAIKSSKSLEFVRIDVRTFGSTKAVVTIEMLFLGLDKRWYKATKRTTKFPAHLLAIDFADNTKYLRVKQPKYLDIQKSMHILQSENLDAVFEVDTFPYLQKNYYLPINAYNFDAHSFIVGASGSGKSKLISLLVDRISNLAAFSQNYRVVVIDPHASLETDLAEIQDVSIVSFKSQSDSLDFFGGTQSDISAATELTCTLFKSLLADQHNPKLDRLLRFSIFVLMTAQTMSLDSLKRFVTDVELRNQVLGHVTGHVPPNIIQFFGADFNELRTKYYNDAIAPIISLVDEMQIQPALTGNSQDGASLANVINQHFLTVFSLNKVSMGEKVVKTIAGLLIQQIFLAAQSRSFGKKIILIIDEVSVVQTPALAQILAEARKYNLFVFLTQQYFGQIDKSLQDAIFTNVSNYYAFRVSEEDARTLEGNLTIELPREIITEEATKGLKESDVRARILTSLNSRECLIRLSAGGQILPCVKARTLDVKTPTAKPQDISLAAYDQPREQLAKFVERPATDVNAPAITIPSVTVNQVNPLPVADAAQTVQPQLQVRPINNLADLLASQSSSRKAVI